MEYHPVGERAPPQSFAELCCHSTDVTYNPTLRQRLKPLEILFVQLMNILVVMAIANFTGWMGLWITNSSSRQFHIIYLTGCTLVIFFAAFYVGLQLCYVFLRDFIFPSKYVR